MIEPEEPPLRIAFVVYGQAAPAGSKRHVGGHRIIDASRRSAPWKNLVAEYAAQAVAHYPVPGSPENNYALPLLDGPLAVKMTFYVPRPKGHYRVSRLREESGAPKPALGPENLLRGSAPVWPTTRPDVLKLARAVEDACTGVIWRDDAQLVVETLVKKYGEPARVEIVVTEA